MTILYKYHNSLIECVYSINYLKVSFYFILILHLLIHLHIIL